MAKEDPISRELIMRLAGLSGLVLSEVDAETSARDLKRLLGYVRKIQELDTEGVPPTSHPFDISCPLRDDGQELRITVDHRNVLESAPAPEDSHFCVPLTVEPAGE